MCVGSQTMRRWPCQVVQPEAGSSNPVASLVELKRKEGDAVMDQGDNQGSVLGVTAAFKEEFS